MKSTALDVQLFKTPEEYSLKITLPFCCVIVANGCFVIPKFHRANNPLSVSYVCGLVSYIECELGTLLLLYSADVLPKQTDVMPQLRCRI